MLRVLCVCSGNTCRSPMAAALLNQKAAALRLPVAAQSAGLAAFAGDPASENAVAVMKERGVDLSAHRSRALTRELLENCDVVVCMSDGHRRALLPYADAEKLRVPAGGVPDPFGGDPDVYRACRDALSAYADALLAELAAPVVRPMEAGDVAAVAALEQQCFSTPWSESALRGELTNPNAHTLVATVCGEICAYLGFHIIHDEGYLCNLAVEKAHRRRGLGRKLMNAAIDRCRAEGCAFLSLEVRVSNAPAIRLYESLGFRPCGLRRGFYTHPDEDAQIMTLYFECKT